MPHAMGPPARSRSSQSGCAAATPERSATANGAIHSAALKPLAWIVSVRARCPLGNFSFVSQSPAAFW